MFRGFGAQARGDQDNKKKGKMSEREVRVELRSLVGRMLWQETWGGFVDRAEELGFWWDDEECMEECRAKCTEWEYTLIEAVRDDN